MDSLGQTKSPYSSKLSDREVPTAVPTAVKVAPTPTEVAPVEHVLTKQEVPAAPKLERKPRKVVARPSVIIPDSVIIPGAARKRGRPIKSNDTEHQQARERAWQYRDRKAAAKVEKAVAP
jgi:hypothetical protein